MLGAFKRLWKLGRASGIGGTAVTQRPASLSKDITTQSEILIAHRTIGPQDVKASASG
jgi:DNA helicase HerA-like ATPase